MKHKQEGVPGKWNQAGVGPGRLKGYELGGCESVMKVPAFFGAHVIGFKS